MASMSAKGDIAMSKRRISNSFCASGVALCQINSTAK